MDSSAHRRFYRLLVRLYPAPFRKAYGREMEAAWVASLHRMRGRWGRLATPLAWARVLVDTLWHAGRLRLGGRCPGLFRRMGRAIAEDARHAARHVRRNPAFTLTTVGILTLGIGLETAVFGAVHSLLLRPPPGVEQPEALVHVYRTRGADAGFLPVSIPLFRDLRDESGEVFSGVAAWTFVPLSVRTGGRAERILGQIVSSGFFDVLGVSMARGRGFSGGGEAGGAAGRVVVVSEGFWRTRLGGLAGVVGTTLEINGTPWEIIGVTRADFRGPLPVMTPMVWAPLSMHAELMRDGDQGANRGNNFLEIVARSAPGTEPARVREWAERFASGLREDHPGAYEAVGLRLHPVTRAGIHPSFWSAQVGFSAVAMAVVGLLLVVAWVNVAGLFLARAGTRHREIAVRRSLGAPRRRLVGQLLLESLFLSLLAGVAGVLVADALLAVVNRVPVPFEWPVDWNLVLDGPALAFAMVVTLVTALAFGLVPALGASGVDLSSSLRSRSTSSSARRSGALFVGAQVAVGTVLLVCAGLFSRNLRDAMAVDTGFRHERLLLATLDPGLGGRSGEEATEVFTRLMSRLRAVAGVRSVGLARWVPLEPGGAQQLVEIPGYVPSPGETMNLQYNVVDTAYFTAMGIPMSEGRGFVASDGAVAPGRGGTPTAAVVNRRFADRFWPGRDVVGRTFRAGGRPHRIVGVVPTGKYQRLGEAPQAFFYLPWPAFRADEMRLHVWTAGDASSMRPVLRKETEIVGAGMSPYDVHTMEEHLALALLPARLSATLLSVLGVVCLLLISAGIHGVVALSVSRRSREVGIRVALGARPAGATGRVVREEARVVLVGLAVGLTGALAAHGWMETLLYSGEALDPAVLLGAPLTLAAVAALASYLPARKAARVDPAQVLRED